MTQQQSITETAVPRLHYGWVIVLALALLGGAGSVLSSTQSLYSQQIWGGLLSADRVWQFVSAGSTVVSLFLLPFLGGLYDRHSVRPYLLAGGLIQSFAFVGLTLTEAPALLTLLRATRQLSGQLLGTLATVKLLPAWFEKRLGLAYALVGLSTSCIGIFGSQLVSRQYAVATTHDMEWQLPCRVVAVCTLLLVLVAVLLIRDAPAQKGLRPFGAQAPAPYTSELDVGRPLAQLKKNTVFLLFLAGQVCFGAAYSIQNSIVSSFWSYSGVYHPRFDFKMLSNISLAVTALSLILLGSLYDRIGLPPFLVGVSVLTLFSAIVLLQPSRSATQWYVFRFLYDMSGGLRGSLCIFTVITLFGRSQVTRASALVKVGVDLGSGLLLLLFGAPFAILEYSGGLLENLPLERTFQYAFFVAALLALSSIPLMLSAIRRASAETVKPEAGVTEEKPV